MTQVDYITGLEVIDEHHSTFISIFNDISTLQNQDNNTNILPIIERLDNYAIKTFKKEEDLLKKAGFQDYEDHVLQHELFVSRVNHFKLQYNYNNSFLSKNIYHFLKKWLITHVLQADMKFISIVAEYQWLIKIQNQLPTNTK